MTPEAQSAFAQLLSVGLVWISFHCVGMCGPLLVGLDVAGVSRGLKAGDGARAVLAYQSGRALTYSALGAGAGALGASLRAALETAGAALALLAACVIFLTALRRLVRARGPALVKIGAASERSVVQLATLRLTLALLRGRHGAVSRALALGMGLGLLPCMIPLWVLGLAAVTGSALAGVGLMLTLVAMTTPVLLGVTLLPRVLRGPLARAGHLAPTLLLAVSGAWLSLVGLAGLGVIPHAHASLELLGRSYSVMFF